MPSLINGYILSVVARTGQAADVPNLLTGEFGYDTDKKTMRIGDNTPSPPRLMTTKSIGDFDFSTVNQITLPGGTVASSDGTVGGVNLPSLNASNGLIARRAAGQFTNVVLGSSNGSVLVANGNGATAGLVDLLVNPDAQFIKDGDKGDITVSGGGNTWKMTPGNKGDITITNAGVWQLTGGLAPDYYCVDTGSVSNTIVASFAPAPSSLTSLIGKVLRIQLAHDITAASTVNINGFGPVSLKLPSGANTTTGSGATGNIIIVVYDGTNIQLTSQTSPAPSAQVNADWNAVSGAAFIYNKPTIPAAQQPSDWNASSGVTRILNKPTTWATIQQATMSFTPVQSGGRAGYTVENGYFSGLNLPATNGRPFMVFIKEINLTNGVANAQFFQAKEGNGVGYKIIPYTSDLLGSGYTTTGMGFTGVTNPASSAIYIGLAFIENYNGGGGYPFGPVQAQVTLMTW